MNKIRQLSNGIRVVSEYIPYLKSVSIGVWIGNGSCHEKATENGISHYIEHMLFKGTGKRTAKEITFAIDSVGGRLNAFTANEYTCFYTKTLDAHAPLAIDILSDMLYNSTLKQEDMDLERRVIFEEIDMCADEPEEVVHDLIMEAAYGDTSMGRTILGTKESLLAIDSQKMRDYLKTHYTSKNTVIAISGHFDESVFDLLEDFFGKREMADYDIKGFDGEYKKGKKIKYKETEQTQLILGFRGVDIHDERIYPLMLFNNIFGEGMSSRLFQNIREKCGLVYSVYAYHSSFKNTGMFNIAAGFNVSNTDKVCKLISDEINAIKKDKISNDEFLKSKEQLKGNYILSYENTGTRMQSAGRSLIMDKPIKTPEEVIDKIENVTKDEVLEVIDEILVSETLCIAAVGTIDETKEFPIEIK